MGTPDFAVPSLERLYEDGHEISAVFTQPDKPRNRGMKPAPPPVKRLAEARGTPVYQPASLRDPNVPEVLKSLRPDLIVVAAYGKLLPPSVLKLPRLGCVNVHASLLPKYRGAAPIHWAVLNGETETGITIMSMAEALDAGDVLLQMKTPIGPEETSETLHDRLSVLGAEALSRALPLLAAGKLLPVPQDHDKATYAPMLSRELSEVDWNRPAAAILNQIRGLLPWPAAGTNLGGKRLKLLEAKPGGPCSDPAGMVLPSHGEGILVSCGDGSAVCITRVQGDGGKKMAASDYLRGHPVPPGTSAGPDPM